MSQQHNKLTGKWKLIDMSGQRFGRLVVQKNSYVIKRNEAYWKCKCDCGKETVVRGHSLRHGLTKSCGCFQKEFAGKINQLPEKQASFNLLLRKYQEGAKLRKLVFELNEAEFRKLTSDFCFYCGEPPIQSNKSMSKECNGTYYYNGIDRLDNSKGYTKDNCVSCCKRCNRMKGKLSFNGFLEQIKKINKKHSN